MEHISQLRSSLNRHFKWKRSGIGIGKTIKSWSRQKKEGLIRGDWQGLSIYAKRRKKFD
ncbi:hypothetical protein AQULUS_13230 [Aquicella lusitana]|uniref:Uncharacterized protein n=1 Tax=Aquicella lusitana TaxID=254246 RepID=A0A370GJ96_9COXI|nr:hypothetical protein C8D86_11186 [Aquicella lusitana]VVC73580.1 hypothetical protein AQULUS_13230 [Aquicella lusitana]